MSSEAERALQAIRGPLEFALAHPEKSERVRDLGDTLVRALRRAEALCVPADARDRIVGAARRIEAEGPVPQTLAAVRELLAPLLAPGWAQRVLAAPPTLLPGVGPKLAAALARKQIHSVEDLLFFLPRAYEDRREIVPIAKLEVGRPACFAGTVIRTHLATLRNGRRMLEVVVSDGTAAVSLKWFRGLRHFTERLRPGQRLLVAGDVRRYRYSKEVHHPDLEWLAEEVPLASLPRIVPSYSGVEGIPPRSLRRLVETAVRSASDLVEAWLPERTARDAGLAEVGPALREVHLPGPQLDPARLRERRTPYHLRLVAEELFLLQVGLEQRRAGIARRRARPLAVRDPRVARAIAALPFELTEGQRRAWAEIAADLARPHPMNRLLIGDVGTGKTVLAVLAAVAAAASKALTAVLAPTEILAEQHYETFRRFAGPTGLRVALLTGSTGSAERRSVQRLLRLGELSVVVGTHALLSEGFELPGLELVVIDEQQRFGVEQRARLPAKGAHPHVLGMSATPIPRTLALTVFGDLDHSVLRERPPGRAPVHTRVLPPGAGREVFDLLRRTLARGEQAYVVYPAIEESAVEDLKDATRGYQRLRRSLPDVPIALLHGRMEPAERARAMRRFASGEVRVLVTTSVIEVGVDVPEATLLVVQHAERFGLAQLHQLRGRVGRSGRPGTAILLGDPKGEDASRRLAILEASDSGFEIAEEDLRIRGAGQWLGTRQAGHLPELRLADLVLHGDLLDLAREAARRLLARDPDLAQHAGLRAAVERRWGRALELGSVA
jgi:ATP-dependent DNA helicase RecG